MVASDGDLVVSILSEDSVRVHGDLVVTHNASYGHSGSAVPPLWRATCSVHGAAGVYGHRYERQSSASVSRGYG
jgi:hypothetical protein